MLGGVKRAQDDGLVADNSSRSINGSGVSTPELDMALGPDYKKSGFDRESVKPVEIEIRPVHYVEGPGLARRMNTRVPDSSRAHGTDSATGQ